LGTNESRAIWVALMNYAKDASLMNETLHSRKNQFTKKVSKKASGFSHVDELRSSTGLNSCS
jgi:hypothetical protein